MYDMYDYDAVSAILSALYTSPFPDEPIKPADSVFLFSGPRPVISSMLGLNGLEHARIPYGHRTSAPSGKILIHR